MSIKETEMVLEEMMSKPEAAALLLQAVLGGNMKGQVRKAIVVGHETPPTISIPTSMSKLEASKELKRQWEEEETEIDVDRRFEGWKWQDVLVAVKITAEKYFGWINAQQSFMNPPTEIEVVVDYENGLPIKTTCFYGQFRVAALDNGLCNIGVSRGEVIISFNLKKKYKERITEWYNLIDEHLRKSSIYRGKSVVVTGDGDQFGNDVNFEIIETKSNPKIVLNKKEKSIIEQYCALDLQEHGKRTYLFTGPYGNGKTEAAMILGDYAKALGMTFFYVKDSNYFVETLSVAAKFYSPCFIFMEDIDEVGSGDERTQRINELLNTLDGAETKNKSIKVLFTTNHHDSINPALRRPGRLDLIVQFNNPERETVKEIFKKYFAGVNGEELIDYDFISGQTPDCSGAFVAEICKRSVRLAQINNGLSNELVEAAINTISDHLKMMSEPTKKGNELENAMKVIAEFLGKHSSPIDESVLSNAIGSYSQQIASVVVGESRKITKSISGAAKDNLDATNNVHTLLTKMIGS